MALRWRDAKMREIRVKNASIKTVFSHKHNIDVEIRNNKDFAGIAVYLSGVKVFDSDFAGGKHYIKQNGIKEENMSQSDKNDIEIEEREN